MASLEKGAGIRSPVLLVKINCYKIAALILEQRIDADNKRTSPIIASRQVPANNLVRNGQKTTIGTVCALDPRFLTDASYPFICASWLVPCPPGLSAFEANRINVLSPSKQGSKQRDFGAYG